MIKKLLKSFTVFLVILGISFSNMPFEALTFFIDSYQKTSGIVDKIWLIQQSHNSDVVDKFVSLRNISDKLRIHEAHASTFVAVSNYNSAGSASALVNKPAGTINNDMMFALVMRNTATAPTTVPVGWTLLGSHINGVYQQRLYWKLAAGEGASYTWAWAASAKTAITIAAYRGGFDTSNPIDVVSNTEFVTTPNTTVRAASMNVAAPNSSLFWFGTLYSTTVRTWTKPSIPTTGWVENYDGGATTSDFSRTIDSMVWAGSGATGNMDGTVVTGGTTAKHAFAVALKPIPVINPDATSVTYQVGGDGARSGYSATITGTNFGAVSAGSRANCAGGAGTGCVRFIVGGNATVADVDVTAWSDTSISFTVDNLLASYGGLSSLQIVNAGASDSTPLNFYIYPNITSVPISGQIGGTITVAGDHFDAAVGIITINTKTAVVGTWGETDLFNVKIPGQEGAVNIAGKIELTRSDAKTSNQYPDDPSNFTIAAPTVSGAVPNSATTGETLLITFSGSGIDTDDMIAAPPVLKLTNGQPDNCLASSTCIIGTSQSSVVDYLSVSASFDLTGAAIGYWKLVVLNMDGQSGSFGAGFYISAPAPFVYGVSPVFGLASGVQSIDSITGENFQNGAFTVKLKKGIEEIPSYPLNPFEFSDPATLLTGAFDLLGKSLGGWDVIVTNPDLQVGSCGGCFEIRSATPSVPTNIYQFKDNLDEAHPPTTNIAVGAGVGGQTNVYFRMNIVGGLTGALNPYTPQVEVKQVGAIFDGTSVLSGNEVVYDGITPALGWVNVPGLQEGARYHWRARASNASGDSEWAVFGGNPETEHDFYIDNSLPEIYQTIRGDNACDGAYFNVTDLTASIKWQTYDEFSGALTPPGSGPYATAQVDYKKSTDVSWNSSSVLPRDLGVHQIDLTGLLPSTTYLFRMRSKDAAGNEKIYEDALICKFDTNSTQPIKTVELFIGQELMQNTGTQIAKNFSIYIPESPGATVSVKSAFIEISAVTNADAAQRINVELRRGLNATFTDLGAGYDLDSTGTVTPFMLLFDTLNPPGTGQQNMGDISAGATNYSYTLFLNGNGTAISLFSAKLVITYSYAL